MQEHETPTKYESRKPGFRIVSNFVLQIPSIPLILPIPPFEFFILNSL